ncbi:hypothetical protein PMSD_20485 [Paenibacillus macquariensis subsp. defensor]|nr:hypothetical protein PMSD_20485 [Paenibacillus macquariensis subsp. defensor]
MRKLDISGEKTKVRHMPSAVIMTKGLNGNQRRLKKWGNEQEWNWFTDPMKRYHWRGSIIQYPPRFNSFYNCSVITGLQEVRAEKSAMILALQNGLMTPDELSKHHRATIKDIMSLQQDVDFVSLAAQHWAELIAVPCALVCGKANHLPVQEVRSG